MLSVQKGTHLELESKLSACLIWVALGSLSDSRISVVSFSLSCVCVWGFSGDERHLWAGLSEGLWGCGYLRAGLLVGSPGLSLGLVIQT